MKHQSFSTLLAVLLVIVITAPVKPAEAARFTIRRGPPDRLQLRVGSSGGRIDVVSFSVPLGQVGNGSVVTGSSQIRIQARVRTTARGNRTAILVADSSRPMRNGKTVMPMSSIRWRSRRNRIPAGTFDDSSNQLIHSFMTPASLSDTLVFEYDNTQILAGGTYTGRVTYTLLLP